MKRVLAAILAVGMMAGAAPAFAEDGHGNAANPERPVPNTGDVSGGPAHRDNPRVQPLKRASEAMAHSDDDGHAHGRSSGKK